MLEGNSKLKYKIYLTINETKEFDKNFSLFYHLILSYHFLGLAIFVILNLTPHIKILSPMFG